MNSLLTRFLSYARINTKADETSSSSPSSSRQLELSRLLFEECQALGLEKPSLSEHGIVIATIPATVKHNAPTIAWFAHVDTSPEYNSEDVNPVVHENYSGADLALPGDPTKVLKPAENPELKQLVGKTIITTDGTTLLGADDKCGIAEIMTAAERLMGDRGIPHGPIRVCFTVDEEIGRGTENLDLEAIDAVCGYTLDSSGTGRIDAETFSADLATVTVHGINTHPSEGKERMVNAIRILSKFLARLPLDHDAPESTDDRAGFMHPYQIEGGVARASARIILRDFETSQLTTYREQLEAIATDLSQQFPRAKVEITTKKQYRNMRDGLGKEPRALQFAIDATKAAGMEPELAIIRGGTDGSLLTELGLPTPNLSSGQHNPHSPLEWTCLEEMEQAVDVLIELAKIWGRETK